MSADIRLLYYPDDITLLHSLFPLLRSPARRRLVFTPRVEDALRPDGIDTLIVFRLQKLIRSQTEETLLDRLRDRYRRLIVFDDTADPREVRPAAVRVADQYFKKQLCADRDEYRRTVYGKRLFSDYYHRTHGIEDRNPTILDPLSEEDIGKLRLSWNLGIGSFPRSSRRQGALRRLPYPGVARLLHPNPLRHLERPVLEAEHRDPKISARFAPRYDKATVAYQREHFSVRVGEDERFLTGTLSRRAFARELSRVAIVLSPFGWGEICFRDFEAVTAGAVLMKPSMSHIETWPDIYRDGVTYASVDWDGARLEEVAARLLADPAYRNRLAQSAREIYADAFRELSGRVERFFEEVRG